MTGGTLSPPVLAADPERAAVGAVLLLPMPDVTGILTALRDDDPDDPRLRVVVAAARELAAVGTRPDPVAVVAHAVSSGKIRGSSRGQLGLLTAELASVEGCPIPAAGQLYAAAVIEAAVRRRVIEASDRLSDVARQSPADVLADVVAAESADLAAAVARLDPDR